MTIETRWVRVFLSTPKRILATGAGLFLLVLAIPIALAIVGLWLIGLLVCLVGVACVAALVVGMLPGRRH
jgi:hypothetical protein